MKKVNEKLSKREMRRRDKQRNKTDNQHSFDEWKDNTGRIERVLPHSLHRKQTGNGGKKCKNV